MPVGPHKHQWQKVYRLEGTRILQAGIWVKTDQGGYNKHLALVCLKCGTLKIRTQSYV